MNNRVYALTHGLLRLFSRMPVRVLYGVSDGLYFLVRHVARYRRAVVRRNLKASFPEKDEAWRKKVERRFYHFFCDYLVETLELLTLTPEKMRHRLEMRGTELLEEALQSHDFAFVYLGHYGNWEYASSLPLWVGRETHCAQLYSPLHSAFSDRLFYEMRIRFGSENIPKKTTLRRLLALQSEGKKTVVGFISDQAPRRVNIHDWVPFLHQDTPVFTGTERLAAKLGAAAFYCDMERLERGRYRCTFRPMSACPLAPEGYPLTEEYMRLLEKSILRDPSIWLWTHNRWKRKRRPQDMPQKEKTADK